jgi:hypothetical protein
MVIDRISANSNEKLARYAIVGVLILIGVWSGRSAPFPPEAAES